MDTKEPLELKTVVHLVRPAGVFASNLEELLKGIAAAPDEVLFYHAVQYQLRDPNTEELEPDDFSAWVGGVVQDRETAERLSFVVQTRNASATELRAALFETLNTVPEKVRIARDAPAEGGFAFLAAQSVILGTGVTAHDGPDLMIALGEADAGAWFYHLIQEPWFANGRITLADWLVANQENRMAAWLRESAAGGEPIDVARRRLLRRWQQSLLARRVANATGAPENERRDAARVAVARLVRRLSQSEP